jgi:outer membrane lipoprotein SlyB
MFKVLLSLLLASLLSACAVSDFGSPNAYQQSDVQNAGSISPGTVIAVRSVTIHESGSGSGLASLISAGLSAFLGSQVIGNGNGRYIAGVLTEKVSAVLQRHDGLEIVVRMQSGRTMVIVQSDVQRFSPGDRVFVVSTSSGLRVTH